MSAKQQLLTRISIDGRDYRAHRLVRLYMRGKWPEPGFQTDHADGDKSNNRLANLRHATTSQNAANRPAPANSCSRLKGVSKRRGKWLAYIMVNRKQLYLGLFDTPELAASAYKAAAEKHFGKYARAA